MIFEDRLELLKVALSKKKEWIKQNIQSWNNWEGVKKAFKKTFCKAKGYTETLQEIFTMFQNKNKQSHTFVERMRTKFEELEKKMPVKQKFKELRETTVKRLEDTKDSVLEINHGRENEIEGQNQRAQDQQVQDQQAQETVGNQCPIAVMVSPSIQQKQRVSIFRAAISARDSRITTGSQGQDSSHQCSIIGD
ncbi:hypothetical protein KQX54_002361 [Cotesia glomerata]|uniref:Uncharacterized protein n=1 Tax=Cotesia glomerata TaxID=32391 RepID=A0AAV7HG87_COTGL|nr:hypothetical protein KQX54_002361 [Cotesia glomerata]